MRDDALAKVGMLGPEYTIVNVEENPNLHIRRRILGKMKVPLYLDKPEDRDQYALAMEQLCIEAESPTRTIEILEKIHQEIDLYHHR